MQPGAEGSEAARVADVWLDADGIVVVRFHAGARVTTEAGAEVVRGHVAAAAGQKRRALIDLRGMVMADRSARELAAGPTLGAVTSRMALVVGSPVSRTLGNFFLRVARPAYPTRLFTDEVAARRWLSEEP